MATGSSSDSSDSEPQPGPSGVKYEVKTEAKSDDSSTSESDISAFSENFNPMKALYSERIMLLVPDAPIYDNLHQFEASLKSKEILPVGKGKEVQLREEKKLSEKLAFEKALEEKNRLRFAKYEGPVKVEKKDGKNVFTREERIGGPLGALRRCIEYGLKVKVMTRGPGGVRGYLYGFVVAFDKHWNMVLTEVLEVYRRRSSNKLKTPAPAGGRPVDKGTADMISPVPSVMETPIGGGVWECARHVPQLMDPANIQSKHQKHQAFEAELAANAERIQSVLAMGDNLVQRGQCSGSEDAVQVTSSSSHKEEHNRSASVAH